jgi:hypothetical protein
MVKKNLHEQDSLLVKMMEEGSYFKLMLFDNSKEQYNQKEHKRLHYRSLAFSGGHIYKNRNVNEADE